MLMKKYAGSVFLKVDDFRNRPRQERIAAVNLGKYDRPVAVFEGGDQLTLNATNTKTLIRSYGDDSRGWVGHAVELSAGKTDYQGKPIETVIVKPISSPTHYGDNAKTASAPEQTEADEIPF
jgi:hypothetical protein